MARQTHPGDHVDLEEPQPVSVGNPEDGCFGGVPQPGAWGQWARLPSEGADRVASSVEGQIS
ncbi:hypothetical protein Shyhy02_39570 [Streptomyces hygroscopicus subsp. hygroscopicus]|nr:hypothetical protein Shyhy02_39570 [Streptomyces hygroscopicus subsp. hygroscopicus]